MHSEGLPSTNVPKGATPVAKDDPVLCLFQDVEVTLDPALEVHQDCRDLVAVQTVDMDGIPVGRVDLLTDRSADDADVARGLLDADDAFKRSGQLAQQRSEEQVALKRKVGVADGGSRIHCRRPLVPDGS